MSLSRTELEAMDRDELINEIQGMDRRINDTQMMVYEQLMPRLNDLEDRVGELEAENNRLRTRLESQSSTSKDGKVAAIVNFAANKAGAAPAVKLDYEDIMGATGCSARYAYDLMDRLPEEYDWMLTPEQMTQYGAIEIDNYDERRLGVDLEGVHSSGAPLNKFNNDLQSEGGA